MSLRQYAASDPDKERTGPAFNDEGTSRMWENLGAGRVTNKCHSMQMLSGLARYSASCPMFHIPVVPDAERAPNVIAVCNIIRSRCRYISHLFPQTCHGETLKRSGCSHS